MNLPHRTLDELHDLREDCLPKPIKHFVPAKEKLPNILGSRDTILEYLSSKSHKRSYLDTIVLYMQSLEDLYTLWQLGVIDNTFATSERSQFEMKYPLSPQQRAIYSRYLSLVQTHRCQIYGTWSPRDSSSTNQLAEENSTDHLKYQLLLGCPGTGKTQVVKRLVHTLIEEEYSVTVCAPLGLLATNYREEFYPDLQADTIHVFFNIPVAADQQYVVNYNIGKYDAIIIDEALRLRDDPRYTRETGLSPPRHHRRRRKSTTALTDDQRLYDPDHVDLEEPLLARSLPDPLPVSAVPLHRQAVYGLLAIHPI